MDAKTKAIIATLFLPSLMIGTDFTGAMMLVVPIEHEYAVDITTTQWVLNAYALTLAMMSVTGGRLGDMFGRRRFLLIGLAIFLAASLACTVAPSVAWLIGARAVQGLGAAIAWPCVLAIAATSVEQEERGFVMSLVLGAVGIGNVISPFIAGVLGGLGEWRAFFFVNVVMAAVSAILVWRVLPNDKDRQTKERIDFGGMAVLSLALFGLLFGLDVGAGWGWASLSVLGLFLGCAVLFAAFPVVEGRVADPMVPPPMMRNRQLMLALPLNGLVAPGMFLLFLYMPQYLHKVLGWSALWASIGTLPILICLAAVNATAGRYYNSVGPRRLLAAGHVLVALGGVWVILLSPSWGYVGTVPPMVLIGVGCGLIFGPAGAASINAADPSRAGLAGALAFTLHLTLGAIGVGGATALMFGASLDSFRAGLEEAGITLPTAELLALNAGSTQGQAVQPILDRYGPAVAEKITTAVVDAFAVGLHQAYWLALAFAVLGLVISLCLDESKLGRKKG